MSPRQTVQSLLAAAGQGPQEDERAAGRIAARVAWVGETLEALRQADRRVLDAWDRILAALPDHLPEQELERIPEPPEQAERDALHARIAAVRDHDRWPRELYWGSI